jgi:diguanylate cyclase (GGDEF)-like protein
LRSPSASPLPTLRQLLARVHLRLILFAVSLAAASMVVSGVIVIRNHAHRNLELIARTVGYSVEPAVVFDDRQAIREAMIPVVAVAGVGRVEVRSPADKILAEWNPPEPGLNAWFVHAADRLFWPRPTVHRIERDGATIAEVRISGNSANILRYALSGVIIALSCIVLAVFATRILARRLQRDLIDPLDHVAEVAHAVRRDRAFEKRVPSSGIAEIDRFGQDFNALLAELQGWHAGLTSENAELVRRASHDGLTGLGNRGLFEQSLSNAIGASLNGGESFAVLYLDVDGFKAINDGHGHASGDAALIAVAERLRDSIRPIDRAFRLGGDEFAVLLAPFEERSHVDGVLARIRLTMEQPFRLPSGLFNTSTLSIGVAVYPDDGASLQDLLRSADAEMYKHKRRVRSDNAEGDADA